MQLDLPTWKSDIICECSLSWLLTWNITSWVKYFVKKVGWLYSKHDIFSVIISYAIFFQSVLTCAVPQNVLRFLTPFSWRFHVRWSRWEAQFYIQLLFKPHFGKWILPFGLLGSKKKFLKRRNFCLSMLLFEVIFLCFHKQKSL